MLGIAIRGLLSACVLTSIALADPQGSTYVSAGISIGYGSRGVVVGTEATLGVSELDIADGLGFAGAVAGFEVALAAPSGAPWGRLYLEGELGVFAFGFGVGPALLLGERNTVGLQATPFAVYSHDLVVTCGTEPFTVVSPFYRYTARPGHSGLHDGGVFVKALVFPNGIDDTSVCSH